MNYFPNGAESNPKNTPRKIHLTAIPPSPVHKYASKGFMVKRLLGGWSAFWLSSFTWMTTT